MNFGQRQILTRQLIYDHPITIALAPAACGKSRTAAYYLTLRSQNNPGELIIVAVEGNKPAQRLVAAYDQIAETTVSGRYKLLLLQSNTSRYDHKR